METTYQPLDKKLAYLSHHGTSFSPEKRGEDEIRKHKEAFDGLTEELGGVFTQAHADKLHILWTDWLHSHSNVMSSMITGPANFPVARNRKRGDWADNKRQKIWEFCDNLRKWKRKADKIEKISAAGGELAMKKAELENSLKWHEAMKTANKIIKSAIKSGGINAETRESLRALGINTMPESFEKYGFRSFELTNSNARIKNQTARVAELERREAAKESGLEPKEFEIDGGKVTYDYAENRINVKHDEKPPREIIDTIKSHGFRWSRNFSTWTRKMTPNAKYSTKSLIAALGNLST